MTLPRTEQMKYLLILLIVIIPLFSLGISNHGLWSADEPRVAEIGREMAETANWAVPMLNKRPFLEEPPLYYGALALTFKAFGASDKVARLPSALFSFATVLVVFFLARFLFDSRTALFSGIVLATGSEYFRVSHWIVVDSALTFFIVSAVALFIRAYLSDDPRKKLLCYILLYVSCGLAFYCKGFIGVVIPGLAILAFLIADRNIREILRMRIWLGVLIFVVLTFPWFAALWHQGADAYLKVFFLHNHLQRFLPKGLAGAISSEASGHHHPFYYYLTEFPNGFLPWSILLIPVLVHVFRKGSRGDEDQRSGKGLLLAKCWFFAGLVFLSLASTKRTLYLMPIFAPFSMMTASYMAATLKRPVLDRTGAIFLWIFALLLVVFGAALTPLYLWAVKIYEFEAASWLFPSVVGVSLAVTGVALAGAFCLRKRRLGPFWLCLSLPIIIVLIFTSVAIVPLIDREKSFVPFCRQITSLVPADRPLYGYKADETLRGAVPFYSGRFMVEVEGLKEIPADKGLVYLAIRDKGGKLERELMQQGTLHPIARQTMGSDRTLVLFSSDPSSLSASPKVVSHNTAGRRGEEETVDNPRRRTESRSTRRDCFVPTAFSSRLLSSAFSSRLVSGCIRAVNYFLAAFKQSATV